MEELAKDFHGWFAMALHALAGPISGWRSRGSWSSWYLLPAQARHSGGPAAPLLVPSTTLLDNKYYFDWFNENVLSRAARMLGTALWKGGDVGFIDGVLIDGSASGIGGVARATRRLQSGYLYWYALVMIVGVIGLMTWQLWPFLASFFGR